MSSPPRPRERAGRLSTALALLVPALVGCQTIELRSPIAASGEVRVGLAARAFEVVRGEREVVGLVVLFEGATPAETHYMVRNVWHQDLGLVDSFGRAYRYLPHHRDAAWIGTGTVGQGVERILGIEECRLFEVPFREFEPAHSPGQLERRRADRGDDGRDGL